MELFWSRDRGGHGVDSGSCGLEIEEAMAWIVDLVVLLISSSVGEVVRSQSRCLQVTVVPSTCITLHSTREEVNAHKQQQNTREQLEDSKVRGRRAASDQPLLLTIIMTEPASLLRFTCRPSRRGALHLPSLPSGSSSPAVGELFTCRRGALHLPSGSSSPAVPPVGELFALPSSQGVAAAAPGLAALWPPSCREPLQVSRELQHALPRPEGPGPGHFTTTAR
ncbi:hypothetical protein EYF80_050131 [Liparis tanakae]|uniref:Uncharacterized protein n=1 Tax=Liparis tanakae TaxID=230148 RepID=A0A4Z2FEP2_9TELE|nr:hypothetical protein EYF80_050131 [Liparis tanakae]